MLSLKIVEKSNYTQIIEMLRQEMIETGLKEGLTSKNTIQISQKLDWYITRFQVFIN